MAKEFKKWIDEFVKNGANPKNVPRWPEDAGGSETKVVTELPQVGEEHTIYELRETSRASYGWMFTLPSVDTSESINLVFDTYEQMTKTMNEIKVIEGNTYPKRCLAYIRNTNQMYILNPVFTDQPHWKFKELPKQDDESGTDYAFKVEYTENRGPLVITHQFTYYILKEFVANERPFVDGGFEYSGITLDDKEVYVRSSKLFGVLSNITYPRWTMLLTSFFGYPGAFIYDKLPDSVELETKCYNLLRCLGTYGFDNVQFAMYNTTDNAYYLLNPKTTAYQWYNNLEDRENCYFAQSGNYEGEPPHYTGKLEWQYQGSFDDYLLDPHLKSLAFNEIPYNDMINHNPPFNSGSYGCAFQPKKGGEVTSTYWIYTNESWFNADEIREFETQEKTISPSTDTQQITPDEGYDGLSKVTVNAVTSNIDADIKAENIKKGVSILGVTGTYEGSGTTYDVASLSTRLPQSLDAMGVAQIGNNVYLFGGRSNRTNDTIYKFDTDTETISALSTRLPQGLDLMGVAQIGSNVYLFGGRSSNGDANTIYKFDTDTETISTLSVTLPQTLYDMGVAQIGNNVYLFGGHREAKAHDTIYKFNAKTETISTLSVTLPRTLSGMGVAQMGSNVYLFGGVGSNGNVNDIYKFDTDTETISTLSVTLPRPLYSMGVATFGSNVYLFGGLSARAVNTIYKFNVEAETISTLSTILPKAFFNMGVAQMGSNVYLFGGLEKGISSKLYDIYKFNINF